MEAFEKLSQAKQQRIINAALREFSDKSYRSASTNTITEQAGISKGALFHYFGSKQQLYHYLKDHTSQQIKAKVLDGLPRTDDLIELFQIISQRKAKLATSYPLMFDFLYRVFREQPEDLKYTELVRQTVELMNVLSSDTIDTSRFREGIDLAKAIDICSWMTEGYAKKYAQTHPQMAVEDMLVAADELFDTLRVMLYKEGV